MSAEVAWRPMSEFIEEVVEVLEMLAEEWWRGRDVEMM